MFVILFIEISNYSKSQFQAEGPEDQLRKISGISVIQHKRKQNKTCLVHLISNVNSTYTFISSTDVEYLE